MEQVLAKAEGLRDASGETNRREVKRKVESANESVRGIWSPFHEEVGRAWKV